jgi:hypothetical protein
MTPWTDEEWRIIESAATSARLFRALAEANLVLRKFFEARVCAARARECEEWLRAAAKGSTHAAYTKR